ncbi:MAG: PAQR family membrane homeostasis protein TrhA [Candidatus Izemoplasmataceae bacterium]
MDNETVGEWLANAISHGIGVLMSIIAFVILVISAETTAALAGVIVFGVTMIVLYLSSTLYHSFPKSMNRVVNVFKRFDHIAIYFLIAGTYTGFVLPLMAEGKGITLLIILWTIAIVGSVFKAIWIERFKPVHIILYLGMGWSVFSIWPDIRPMIPEPSMILLVIGGISYTGGIVFFGLKRPFTHFIWHLFVIGGTLAHFFSIYYII